MLIVMCRFWDITFCFGWCLLTVNVLDAKVFQFKYKSRNVAHVVYDCKSFCIKVASKVIRADLVEKLAWIPAVGVTFTYH